MYVISVILTTKNAVYYNAKSPLCPFLNNCSLACARKRYRQPGNFTLEGESQTRVKNMIQRVLLLKDIVALQIQ